MVNHFKTKQLVPGKWYTSTEWSADSFAKFMCVNESNTFSYSEAVLRGELKRMSWWTLCEFYTEMTEEQKIKFLPKDHSDYPKQELTINTFEIW